MIKFSNKSLLTLALVLAVCVAALVYQFLNGLQQQSNDTTKVMVAKTDILANTLITADMVEEMTVSRKALRPGAITDVSRVINAYAKENIPVQEQISEAQIMSTVNAGFAGNIPSGKRAISIAVTEVTGVAGLIKPGDCVDVIAIIDPGSNAGPVANMIVQNVLVLATDKTVTREDKGTLTKDTKVTTLTLAVTPEEAVSVGLATTKGTVACALRSFAPNNGANAQVTAQTLDNLKGNASYAASSVAAPVSNATPTPNLSGLFQSMFPQAANPSAGPKTKVDYGNKKVVPVIKGTTTQDVFVQ